MTFDLLMSDETTLSQRLAVRIIGRLMGCPSNAFLTENSYRQELAEAGYATEGIVVRDVTENDFPGLVAFLGRQQSLLKQHGLSLGSLAIAKWVFDWFHTSKALRAAIIIVRKDS
ncbi:hypothetical protein ESCO_004558 [Escovopsis weberi]|uniref:Uncharacterized protein n=1 Tax=Escovopsis weberi TaxID=150374 RepID=A0A0M8N6P8_ESCWE|nr:hypothetical protein ESCO_004558 [Escovopsis weberi]